MKHLRIAHLIDLDKVGGVETMFADFIQAPPPPGLEVEHYTIADSLNLAPRFREPVVKASRLLASPKQIGPVKLPRKPRAVRAWRRLALVRRIQPDLILVWNQFTDFGSTGRKLPCPVVYYEHGMSWYSHSQQQLDRFFPYVSAAIGASQAASRMLQLKHNVLFPVTTCLNPLRPGLLPEAFAHPRCLDASRSLRLGMAGRLVPLKAAGLLVHTVKELVARGVEVEAWIAGEGPERIVIEELIDSANLTGEIHLLGLLDDMAKFYQGIDIFVCTSMHEALGLVTVEAMAWGVPVVAAKVDGLPEAVLDGVTGLCVKPTYSIERYQTAIAGASIDFAKEVYDADADAIVSAQLLDPGAIADAVSLIISDGKKYEAMSAAAIKHARSGFRHATYIRTLYKMLLECTNSS